MGKYLETKYSDLKTRVVKKAGKRLDKTVRFTKDQEPPLKKLKLEEVEETSYVPKQFQNLEVKVTENIKSKNLQLKLVESESDLFEDDELKTNSDQFTKFNLLFEIFEEIALEGLDGITIEAFWKRLHNAVKYRTLLDVIENFIWYIIKSSNSIQFFKLPEPRKDLISFNRYEHINEEIGMFLEVYNKSPDIYKVEIVPRGDVWGSCPTFTTRIDISEKIRVMTLDEAYSTYKNKLVIVANQKLRTRSLVYDNADPNYDMQPTEYCVLERIGRARESGEITQGTSSLGIDFNMDPKLLYHYKRRLCQNNLVCKQSFCIRSVTDQNKSGRLLHLPKFYTKKKSKMLIMAEAVIHFLKKCPQYLAPYSQINQLLPESATSKFIKNTELLKYIKTNIALPYREVFPKALRSEYMCKSRKKEKNVKVIQLKDPHINVAACWTDSGNPDSSDEEEENDDDETDESQSMHMDLIREVYLSILKQGKQGLTAKEIIPMFSIDFFTMRAILKKLVLKNAVYIKKMDQGKQKSNLYIAKYFIDNPHIKLSVPQPIETKPSFIVENLKQRQKQKIASLNNERVYTREQFEADQNLPSLEYCSLLPVTYEVPKLLCPYLIRKLTPLEFKKIVFIAEFQRITKLFNINLTCLELREGELVKIRKICPIDNISKSYELQANFESFYTENFRCDYVTKAFLLQAFFNLHPIDEKLLTLLDLNKQKSRQSLKRKRSIGTVENKSNLIEDEKPLQCSDEEKLNYMGPNPTVILLGKENNVVSKIILSTEPESYVTGDITDYTFDERDVTPRMMFRTKVILETVQEFTVVEDIHKLIRIITEKEKNSGYDKKIDRKSLYRIYRNLVLKGYVKIYRVTVSNDHLTKAKSFLCHPSVEHNHLVITTAITQIKWRFFAGDKKGVKNIHAVVTEPKVKQLSPFIKDDVIKSVLEMKELNKLQKISLSQKASKKAGRIYGFKPKFAKMAILHEMIFYLIYEFPKDSTTLSKKEVFDLFKRHQITLTKEDLQQIPPIFCKEISWKMFIPPLPYHQGWRDGWGLICDIILRIPLSLIVKLYSVNFYSSELQEVLQHPIKRFYLLKNQGQHIQSLIMHKRRYVHAIFEIMVKLAYCGLLQFGPSKFKEKEQVFFYLNRKTSLLETMPSKPGYHKVSEMDYNRLQFYLNSSVDLMKYWSTLHNISMNTKLNSRKIMHGKTITLVDVTAKPSLVKAISAKTADEVLEYDNGDVPGDNQGAGGLDSAMWSHISRNWFWISNNSQQNLKSLTKERFVEDFPQQVSFKQLKLPTVSNKVYLTKPQKVSSTKKFHIKYLKTSKRVQQIKRKMFRREDKKQKKEYYDSIDISILQKYGTRRKPCWTEEEDRVLALLKGACIFINPRIKYKQLVSYVTVRDILHRILPTISRDKTSRSCERRLRILTRDIPFLAQIENCLPNLYKLVPIVRYFAPLLTNIIRETDGKGIPFKLSEDEVQKAYVFLTYYIASHRKEVEIALQGNMITVDYLNKENLEYSVKNIVANEEIEVKYFDPKDENSIRQSVLKSLFHSALGSRKDHPAWSYQLYKIYQKFNDTILKSTITELKQQRMISAKRNPIMKFYTPFKLSTTYIFSQTTTFSYPTIDEAFQAFKTLKSLAKINYFGQEDLSKKKYGQMIGLNEVASFWWDKLILKFYFPEHPLILDPEIKDHSKVIDELARRYQAKLKSEQKDAELEISTQLKTSEEKTLEPLLELTENVSESKKPEQLDEDIPLDLTITSGNSATIDNLKSWISDCIVTERVRSPSPELLNFQVNPKNEKCEEKRTDKEEEVNRRIEPHNIMDGTNKNLTIEEIKQEMLKKTSTTEERSVPYITDLSKLLSENFEDFVGENQNAEDMKRHFVQQFPYLEEYEVEDMEEFNNHFLVEYLDDRLNFKEFWEKVEKEQYINLTNENVEICDVLLQNDGSGKDIELANAVVQFIYNKEMYGATGPELKKLFSHSEGNCSLEHILKTLTDSKILLRTGVCTITFVHHKYQSSWLIESFTLMEDDEKLSKNESEDEYSEIRKGIDKRVESTQWLKIKIVPWAKVDGTLNKDLFKMWLSNIFSFCIDNPKIMFSCLSEKFSFMKPVDLFYLVELLQELGCLEIYRIGLSRIGVFTGPQIIQERQATFLNNFEDIFIEANNISFISLGSFFNKM